MFFHSQSTPEQEHLIKALRFELGKVQTAAIRERMVHHLAQIDATLATRVAKGLGIELPKKVSAPPNRSVPADGDPNAHQHRDLLDREMVSAALSMTVSVPGPIATRKVAILVAPEFDRRGTDAVVKALTAEGAKGVLVGPNLGVITADDGTTEELGHSILTTASVLFDAVYVAGGERASEWTAEADAIEFVKDAYKHCKAVAATGAGVGLLVAAGVPVGGPDDADPADAATIVGDKADRAFALRLTTAMAGHRLWTREPELHLPL